MQSISVIGAGPAGIAASLEAARAGARVDVFEANEVIGRKLLVTGSGRCNITNLHARADKYSSADPNFVSTVLENISPETLRSWLSSLGILTFSTSDGWCYPVSESAQAVADLLRAALIAAGVEIHYASRVTSINKTERGFSFITSDKNFKSDRLIICAGGKALPGLGSKGDLFPVLQRLGHKVKPLLPALAPVLTDMKPFQKLQGVRLDAQVSLFKGLELLAQTKGNLIFTNWGINGPAVMDLSHHVSKNPGETLRIELNFLLEREKEVILLFQNFKTAKVATVLGSILPPKMAAFLASRNEIPDSLPYENLKPVQRDGLFADLTKLPFPVLGVRGFEYCQLKTGGVPVTEINAHSMESQLVPGLYLAGETQDVAGPCGGYNLHYAFASGIIAGKHAAGN